MSDVCRWKGSLQPFRGQAEQPAPSGDEPEGPEGDGPSLGETDEGQPEEPGDVPVDTVEDEAEEPPPSGDEPDANPPDEPDAGEAEGPADAGEVPVVDSNGPETEETIAGDNPSEDEGVGGRKTTMEAAAPTRVKTTRVRAWEPAPRTTQAKARVE